LWPDIVGLIELGEQSLPDHIDGARGIYVLENQNLGNGKKDQDKDNPKKKIQSLTMIDFFFFFLIQPPGNGFYVDWTVLSIPNPFLS